LTVWQGSPREEVPAEAIFYFCTGFENSVPLLLNMRLAATKFNRFGNFLLKSFRHLLHDNVFKSANNAAIVTLYACACGMTFFAMSCDFIAAFYCPQMFCLT